MDKNYDQVRQDVLDIFIQSKNKVGGIWQHRCRLSVQNTAVCIILFNTGFLLFGLQTLNS